MVTLFNTKIQKFPNNVFAGILKFSEEKLFETPKEERKNVKVEF